MGKDRKFLGYRPKISVNPLKFANHYVWETYGDVDLRRRHVGSALTALFKSGELGGGEYETVGIWSANRPGMSFQVHHSGLVDDPLSGRMANHRFGTTSLWEGLS